MDRTDLTHALQESALKSRGSHLVTAMVLVSDGMDNTGRPDFRDWEDTSVPIHGLGFPAVETGDLDLAVRKPTAPERARIHNELRVSVPVAKTGAAAAEATVSLKLGRDVLASQKVNFGPGASEQVVSLAYTPHQAGDFVFTAVRRDGRRRTLPRQQRRPVPHAHRRRPDPRALRRRFPPLRV